MTTLQEAQIAAIKQFTPTSLHAKITHLSNVEWIRFSSQIDGQLCFQITKIESIPAQRLREAPCWFAGISEDRMTIVLAHESELPEEWLERQA